MIYLVIALHVLAENGVNVPTWTMVVGWWIVAARLILKFLIAVSDAGKWNP